MLPSVIAWQVRETIRDYLEATFSFSNAKFREALFAFLTGPQGIFKGPYLQVRMPYLKSRQDEVMPLEIAPAWVPFAHQMKAFQRLSSRDDRRPKHTLITTGTGSGKTECFLYPVLDHCMRLQGTPGIKAIVLYPMNALASDQARRIAQIISSDVRMKGKLRVRLWKRTGEWMPSMNTIGRFQSAAFAAVTTPRLGSIKEAKAMAKKWAIEWFESSAEALKGGK